MEVCVLGAGYVGLVTAVCVAEFGQNVRCLDIDEERIEALGKGRVPFYEPGLGELLTRNIEEGRFHFTTDVAEAVEGAKVVYIAVGTPMKLDDGSVDLSYVRQAAKDIAPHLAPGCLVVDKSTVPVGTASMVREILLDAGAPEDVEVASNPEFLREGSAVKDFMEPDRVVIGVNEEWAADLLKEIYQPLVRDGRDFLITAPEAAELVKYASNAFLAIKITFINELALLADQAGIDIFDVARGIGLDTRIGPKFLRPGPGYGGSCLPKDTNGLLHIADDHDAELNLVSAAVSTNDSIPKKLVARVEEALGSLDGVKIGLLGLAFKAGTDDVRDSPAIALAQGFIRRGASVRAFDPQGMPLARRVLGDSIEYTPSARSALEGADVAVIATEWPEFQGIEPSEIAAIIEGDLLADYRNLFRPERVRAAGLKYIGMGRS